MVYETAATGAFGAIYDRARNGGEDYSAADLTAAVRRECDQ
jgi:hypothetical protein